MVTVQISSWVIKKAFSPIVVLRDITKDHSEQLWQFLICIDHSLANVDPIDVAKSITGLNPETTLGNAFRFINLY